MVRGQFVHQPVSVANFDNSAVQAIGPGKLRVAGQVPFGHGHLVHARMQFGQRDVAHRKPSVNGRRVVVDDGQDFLPQASIRSRSSSV